MKKYVVLSVNENPAYLHHVPLVKWAWRRLGWEPIIFYIGYEKSTRLYDLIDNYFGDTYNRFSLSDDTSYKSETICQVSRLYGACVADGYLMTSDVDMLPLSDYWQPDFENITAWGRDLTDYHYPICYIGMKSEKWMHVMNLPDDRYNLHIKRDLRKQANMWCLDQDIITERLNPISEPINRIKRGVDNRTGYPIGRVDRSNWRLDHKQFIDAHLFHDAHTNEKSLTKILELIHKVWPNENFDWYIDYHKEFKKLLS